MPREWQGELFRANVFPENPSAADAKEVARYAEALRQGFLEQRRLGGLLTNNMIVAMFQMLKRTDETFHTTPGTALKKDHTNEMVYVPPQEGDAVRVNPHIPDDARADAVRKVMAVEMPSQVEENRRLHRLIVEGVPVEYHARDGTIRGDRVRLVDFTASGGGLDMNDWLAINQFTVIERGHTRRPDIVLFLSGLPIAVIELKNPGDENATVTGAYNQLQTYKREIGSLFRTNALLIASDGMTARIGSLTADQERFMPWRTVDGEDIAPKGLPELEVMIAGVLDRQRLLMLIRDFTVFGDAGRGIVKIIAGYHQFHAAQRAVVATLRAVPDVAADNAMRESPLRYGLPDAAAHPDGDRRIGVIWHTQGSGKSFLMAFYAGLLVREPALENPTIVVITDRNDLDDQLFATFSMCADLIRQTPIQIDSREDLTYRLDRASGGVIFTTMQKFAPPPGTNDYPAISDRRNVIVIADEAHRSQYGFHPVFARGAQHSGGERGRIEVVDVRLDVGFGRSGKQRQGELIGLFLLLVAIPREGGIFQVDQGGRICQMPQHYVAEFMREGERDRCRIALAEAPVSSRGRDDTLHDLSHPGGCRGRSKGWF